MFVWEKEEEVQLYVDSLEKKIKRLENRLDIARRVIEYHEIYIKVMGLEYDYIQWLDYGEIYGRY